MAKWFIQLSFCKFGPLAISQPYYIIKIFKFVGFYEYYTDSFLVNSVSKDVMGQ